MWGAGITLLSLILLILSAAVNNINPFTGLNNNQFSQLLFLTAILGLFIIAFSKEKIDDERVKVIRRKALQGAFGYLMSMILSFSLALTIMPGFDIDPGFLLICIAALALISYLAIYYYALYFDPHWAYNEDTPAENFRKNKRFFLIYFSVSIVLFALYLLLASII